MYVFKFLTVYTQEDVFSVELRDGQPRVMLDLGTNPVLLSTSTMTADGHWHRLDIIWGNKVILDSDISFVLNK